MSNSQETNNSSNENEERKPSNSKVARTARLSAQLALATASILGTAAGAHDLDRASEHEALAQLAGDRAAEYAKAGDAAMALKLNDQKHELQDQSVKETGLGIGIGGGSAAAGSLALGMAYSRGRANALNETPITVVASGQGDPNAPKTQAQSAGPSPTELPKV